MTSPVPPDSYTPPPASADGMPFVPIAPDLFPSPTPPQPATPARTLTLPVWVAAITAVALLAVGFVAGRASTTIALPAATATPSAPARNLLEEAADRCSAGEMKDDGKTLVFDMEGEDYGSGDGSFSDWECLVDALGTPQSTQQKMRETRALDGRQDDSWTVDGATVEASWNYHPDDGLDVIFELR